MMNASFLRTSLFTSVVSFGVAAFAIGIGILSILFGAALAGWRRCRSSSDGRPSPAPDRERARVRAGPFRLRRHSP
jgi:hypothetical protein